MGVRPLVLVSVLCICVYSYQAEVTTLHEQFDASLGGTSLPKLVRKGSQIFVSVQGKQAHAVALWCGVRTVISQL